MAERRSFVGYVHTTGFFGAIFHMTKNFLLAATAMTAIAFAGAAGAAEITSASVSGVSLTGGSTPTVYTIATQTVTATEANRQTTVADGDNVIVASVSNDGAFGPGIGGRTYGAKLVLTGAKFQDAVVAGDIELVGPATLAACGAEALIVEGGSVAGTSVTVAITIPPGCAIADAPTGVSFDVPFTLDAAATTASAAVNFVLGAAETPYDGGASTVQLVRKANAYDLTVTADTVPTTLALAGDAPYTALLTGSNVDNVLGSIKVGLAAAPAGSADDVIYANLKPTTAFPTLTYDLLVKAETGNFDAVELELDGAAVVADEDDNTIAEIAGVAAGTKVLTVETKAGNDVSLSTAQAYSVTVTPKVSAATVVAKPANVSGAVQTIGLEGTNFVAPWFTLNNANNTAFLRLSNNGTGSTGPIFLTLKSANGAVSTASVTLTQAMLAEGTLSANGGIAANSAILITGAQLASAFGTSAANGDVQVTIQATDANLTAKARVRTASGVVTETSLGRLGDAGVSF